MTPIRTEAAAPRAAGRGAFVPVPADAARYTADLSFAARHLRCDADWLGLLARDLPCEQDPEKGPRYDYTDLINAVTFSGSGTTYPELAFRFQVKFATESEAAWHERRTWRLSVRTPHDEDGAGTGGYRFVPLDPGAPGVTVHDEAPVEDGFDATVTLDGEALPVRDRLALAVWSAQQDQFASGEVTYQTVAEPLRADAERAWALGMADCVVASKCLAARLRAVGLEARARRGYLLSLVGSEHAWCEVHEGGRWRPMDPVFAFATSGRGTDPRFLDRPAFSRACRGTRFNRLVPCLTEDAGPLAFDGGAPAPPWAPPTVALRSAAPVPAPVPAAAAVGAAAGFEGSADVD